jgi:hypothetical protein
MTPQLVEPQALDAIYSLLLAAAARKPPASRPQAARCCDVSWLVSEAPKSRLIRTFDATHGEVPERTAGAGK